MGAVAPWLVKEPDLLTAVQQRLSTVLPCHRSPTQDAASRGYGSTAAHGSYAWRKPTLVID
jgi:hypothetical protein